MTDETPRPSRVPPPRRPERMIDWKLLFNQLFALEIAKEHVLPRSPADPKEALDRLLRAYTQYSPATFNDAIDEISAVDSSDEGYAARVAFFENPANRRTIAELDFSKCVAAEVMAAEDVREFLDVIWRERERPIAAGERFFESPEGTNAVAAFRRDGVAERQEVALVFVPGFAAHTIKYCLFEEIVQDVNVFHGRPAERPLLSEDGIELDFEGHATFYGRTGAGPGGFDILQPLGRELGNTAGLNAETTDLLYEWIRSLPEDYAHTKLILLGYSKGASIMLDLVARHPDIAPRVLGYVTFCGVVQGSHVARLALEQAGSLLRDVPIGEFVDQIRGEEPSRLGRMLSPMFADIDLSWLSMPRIRAVFDTLGHDIEPVRRQLGRVLGGREVREVLDGARDLSPLERTRWNLAHLDSDTFGRQPTFIFNISAITDVKDFVRPLGVRPDGSPIGSLLTPALTPEGELDWNHLSLDALFLYVSSIEGFKTAPAGLFDTQVDLGGTKTPLIDRRPLSASLTPEEIADLWADDALRPVLRRNGVRSLEELANTPRRDLFPAERCETIHAVDLGEFKGHHWNPFVQALRPPPELSKVHAVWDFPRKAFMRALIQVLAFHNLVRHVDLGETERLDDELDEAVTDAGTADSDEHRDVVLLRTEGEESTREHLVNLYNLAARAASYGLVVNSARTGLGTSPALGRALSTDSLYYQALRVYSYADWEFGRGLRSDPSVWPLPRSLALLVGRFPEELARTFPDEPLERMEEIRKVLVVLAPHLKPFELRRLGQGDVTSRQGARSVSFSTAIRDNLWRGTRAKLASIERDAYSPDAADLNAKLAAMLGAFTPLCTVFSAGFDRAAPERSFTRLTLYVPAFHTLHAEDFDHPRRWYLEKGLRELQLPRPVKLTTAEITRLVYLQDADLSRHQALKVELHRDFDRADRLTSVVSFGAMFRGSADELFALDTSDHRDSLRVVFRPWFSSVEGETPADRRFKEAFNRVFGSFEIEARIHQLTLHHRRTPHGALGADDEDAVLRPRFSLQESRISFRVHRTVDTAVERLPLVAAGFHCEVDDRSAPARFHCWRDFWTWDHLLEEFFAGRSLGGGRLRLPTYFRERLVEQLVGTATKTVLDRSIAAIEDAIDQEIARLVDDYFKRYSRARSVLIDRLHDHLMSLPPPPPRQKRKR